MNLIDKYVNEIGDRLPRKGRADIEAEIRSTLQDMLDDRSRQTGAPVDETMVKAVLKEYGSPAKVAETYKPAQYLISPGIYPMFELVLKVVLAVALGVNLLQLGLAMTVNASRPAFAQALLQFGGGLYTTALTALGNVVFVFAIVDRTLSHKRFNLEDEGEWDPSKLAERPDRDAIKRFDLIISVVFSLITLAVVNLYTDKIGLLTMVDGQWMYVPAVTAAFYRLLPWINLLSVVKIVQELALLRANAWSLPTRLVSLALRAGGIILAAAILTGPAIIAISPASVQGTRLADSVGILNSAVSLGMSIGMTVVIIVGVIDFVRMLVRLATRGGPLPFPSAK